MQEYPTNHPYIEEDEIDIMELISKLWKKRWMIIKWCIGGAILGLIVGFSIPKTYTATVTLAPETQQRTSSSVSSIATMMGVNLNNSIDAISIDMFPDVVHSTPFIFELFDTPVTFERKDSIITVSLVEYMKEYQKSPWWTPVLNFPFKVVGWVMSINKEEDTQIMSDNRLNYNNLPREERAVIKFFAENTIVNVDKKTGMTNISLEMQDPDVVYVVVDAIVNNLVAYMTDYRSSKARQDAENLAVICKERKDDYYKAQQAYADFVDSNKNVIRQSTQAELERLQQEMNLAYQVYSQVATQLEGARIQTEQAKPVFAIINPAIMPINRTAPNKLLLIIVFAFFSLCIVSAWILFAEELWCNFKNKLI